MLVDTPKHQSPECRMWVEECAKHRPWVTHIRVTLMPTDTYAVSTYRIRRQGGVPQVKILRVCEDVHVGSLCTTIESVTGMRTSL